MEFKLKKKYGQNFLIDKNITQKIASLGENKDNSLVIEVGCGDGRLTKYLCCYYTNVICYEIDKELDELLKVSLNKYSNYKIIFKDFLQCDIGCDIKDYQYENLYVIANLPYYITTPIIEKLIELKLPYNKLIFMVQKEVGDRLSAKPCSKNYNSLTVYLNYYFDIKKEFLVSRKCFIPKPNVDSVVVSFTPKKKKREVTNEELFFKLVKDSFKYKRKNIKNNLENYDLEKIEKVLKKYNYDLNVRAEMLSLEVFLDISNELSI